MKSCLKRLILEKDIKNEEELRAEIKRELKLIGKGNPGTNFNMKFTTGCLIIRRLHSPKVFRSVGWKQARNNKNRPKKLKKNFLHL